MSQEFVNIVDQIPGRPNTRAGFLGHWKTVKVGELTYVPITSGNRTGRHGFVQLEEWKVFRNKQPSVNMPAAITKDNSAVVEDSGINASDGSTALRDDALFAGGNAAQDNAFGVGGDFEAGDNNTFIVESADAETAQKVSEAAFNLAEDAFGFGTSTVQEAFEANRFVTEDAFQFADEVNYRALEQVGDTNDTLAKSLDEAFQFARISQDSANRTSQAANTVLAQKSQDAPSAISETLQKNVLIGLGMIAAAIVIFSFNKS